MIVIEATLRQKERKSLSVLTLSVLVAALNVFDTYTLECFSFRLVSLYICAGYMCVCKINEKMNLYYNVL